MSRFMQPAEQARLGVSHGAQSIIRLDDVRSALKRVVTTHPAIQPACSSYQSVFREGKIDAGVSA